VLVAFLLACASEKAQDCPPPDLETAAVDGAPLTLETGAEGLARTRALAINGAGIFAVKTTGPVEVVDAGGTVLQSVTGPAEVYLRATGLGAGRVTLGAGEGCAASVDIVGVVPSPLVGRPRTLAPYWMSTPSVWAGETVWLGLDPTRWPDRVGQPFDVYVVAHRTAAEWADDATLVGVGGTPIAGTFPEVELAPLELGAFDAGSEARAQFDVVVDADRDGRLGPDDLLQGVGDDVGFTVLGDLSARGPHGVETVDADGGRWLGQRVWWPTDLAALGPRPLVVISHGNGHQFIWYDYLGEHLASWGYVVMAHENNTNPGIETASTTTLRNTDWLLGNLDVVGDGALVGLVDTGRIGWIGHSRGGEGVVRALDRLMDGDDTPDTFGADDIRFVASIAPTVFNTVDDSNPHDVPYFLLAGTADGDVTGGVDCPACQFFRIWEAATGPKAAAYVHGASHNDFNCCAEQEGRGPDLIGRERAQAIARAYLLAAARGWLDGDDALLDVFRNEYVGFTPLGLDDADRVAASWRNAEGVSDVVLDDFQSGYGPVMSSSGALVTCTADAVVEDRLDDSDAVMTWSDADPMNGMTRAAGAGDLARGLVFAWSAGASPTWSIALPEEATDTTALGAVSFSVAQRSRHPETVARGADLAFAVTLVDADGTEATVAFADQALVPTPYLRAELGDGAGWANEFVTVRIPLADFTVGSTLDRARLTTLRLDFGAAVGAPAGALALDNVELVP